jgi:hypothetical protein
VRVGYEGVVGVGLGVLLDVGVADGVAVGVGVQPCVVALAVLL